MNDHLYRSVDDRVLAGVAGGMAEVWDLDPAIVRIGWVILTPLTAGFAILVYIVLAIVVPEDRSAAGSSGQPAGVAWTSSSQPASSWAPGPSAAGPFAAGSGAAATPATGSSATGPSAGDPTVSVPSATDPMASGPGAGPATVDQPGAAPGGFAAGFAAVPPGPTPASASPGVAGPVVGFDGPAPGASSWSDARRAERERRRAERQAWRAQRRTERHGRPNDGALVGGLILVLIGAGVLVSELIPDFQWRTAWPIGFIAIGVMLVVRSSWPRSPGA